jgi:DNA polymerase-1
MIRDFLSFEFTTLFKEFKNVLGAAARQKTSEHYTYKTILAAEFPAWCEEFLQQKDFAFDLETTALEIHHAEIVGISVCWDDKVAYYIPVGHKGAEGQVTWSSFVEHTTRHFANPEVKKSGQNIKYDISILELNGISVEGIAFDTMVAAYLLNPDSRSFNLTALAEEFLHLPVIEYDEVTDGAENFSGVTIEAATQYACQDAHYAWLLKGILGPRLEEGGLTKVFDKLEVPLVPVLA